MNKLFATTCACALSFFIQANAYAWKFGDPLFSRSEQQTMQNNVHDAGNVAKEAAKAAAVVASAVLACKAGFVAAGPEGCIAAGSTTGLKVNEELNK